MLAEMRTSLAFPVRIDLSADFSPRDYQTRRQGEQRAVAADNLSRPLLLTTLPLLMTSWSLLLMLSLVDFFVLVGAIWIDDRVKVGQHQSRGPPHLVADNHRPTMRCVTSCSPTSHFLQRWP